jgi:hypothetical protein
MNYSELLENGKKSSGCCCNFVDLENGKGLKVYGSRYSRDLHHDAQVYAAGLGLAPEVFEKFQVAGTYGYVTEVVETLVPYSKSNEYLFDNYPDEWDTILKSEYASELEELEETLGYDLHDSHDGNFGLKNGKLVIIDCDFF